MTNSHFAIYWLYQVEKGNMSKGDIPKGENKMTNKNHVKLEVAVRVLCILRIVCRNLKRYAPYNRILCADSNGAVYGLLKVDSGVLVV